MPVRRELKAQFDALLVDEFQDTDPVQYELLLYLAEGTGQEAEHWHDIQISPGKLFIVGDPKQSIYAFRRAEMEAYDRVVYDLVLGEGRSGVQYTLQANFRSHNSLLAPINACFSKLFPTRAIKGLQPNHTPLLPVASDPSLSPTEGMEIRLVRSEFPDADVEDATLVEAEELARWLREEVLGQQIITEHDVPVVVKPSHIAILFRTLTYAGLYIDALRRYDIPYAIEGEKHFYERQEIIDFINVLRAAILPHDAIAIVAVLRSPLGGISDAAIAELAEDKRLNYLEVSDDDQGEAHSIYAVLRKLNRVLPCLPLIDVANFVLDHVPLLDFAAASVNGEQAIANLYKMRDIIVDLAEQPNMTLEGMSTILIERIHSRPPESESTLIEENERKDEDDGAIRIFSIHKAKGLEFPIVILAGLHRGLEARKSRVVVHHDWSSGVIGVKVGEHHTLGGLYISDVMLHRQEAEQIRILYVAMTRAKRRLVLSSALPAINSRETMLTLLARGMRMSWDALLQELNGYGKKIITLDHVPVPVTIIRGQAPSFRRTMPDEHVWKAETVAPDDQACQMRWHERAYRRQKVAERKPFGTVTAWQRQFTRSLSSSFNDEEDREGRFLLDNGKTLKTYDVDNLLSLKGTKAVEHEDASSSESCWRQLDAKIVGTVAHRVLEGWDFKQDPRNIEQWIQTVWHRCIPPSHQDERLHILDSLQTMFWEFVNSVPYARLVKADILGREIPFSIPWDTENLSLLPRTNVLVMEGTIDLIYRIDGDLWLADYKTDWVEQGEAPVQAARYFDQLQIYRKAVCRCLNLPSLTCEVIFVRHGIAVTMPDM